MSRRLAWRQLHLRRRARPQTALRRPARTAWLDASSSALRAAIPPLWAPPSGALLPLLSSGRRSFKRSDVEDALRLPKGKVTIDAVHRALRALVATGRLARKDGKRYRGSNRYVPVVAAPAAAVDGGRSDAAAEEEVEEEDAELEVEEEAEEEKEEEKGVMTHGGGSRAAPCGTVLRQPLIQLCAPPRGSLAALAASHPLRSFCRSDAEDALKLPRTGAMRAAVNAALVALVRSKHLAFVGCAGDGGRWTNTKRYAPPSAASTAAAAVAAATAGAEGACAGAPSLGADEEEDDEEVACGGDARAVPGAPALRQSILQLCAPPRGALAVLAASHPLRSYCRSDVEGALGLPRAHSNATRCAVRDALNALVRSKEIAFVGWVVDANS